MQTSTEPSTAAATTTASLPTVSVVIPCLNEAGNITACVTAALKSIRSSGLSGEVIVTDTGSDDDSAALATAAGALVTEEPIRGYGNAYRAGFAAARGDYIVMPDADLTYDFAELPRFIAELRDGADMVLGERMQNVHTGAMPWHHRYIGNPLLSRFLNQLFHTGVTDAHCGMRAFRSDRLAVLDLRTSGMAFASESAVRAAQTRLDIREIPNRVSPTWRRVQAVELSGRLAAHPVLAIARTKSPFHRPWSTNAFVGGVMSLTSLTDLAIFGRNWELHALISGSLLPIVGAQTLTLGICAHAYATYFIGMRDKWFDRARERLRLEHDLAAGGALICVGIALVAHITLDWLSKGLGSLARERSAISAATLLVLGIQIVFSSFLISILGLRRGP